MSFESPNAIGRSTIADEFGFPLFSDQDRAVYRAFGFARAGYRQAWSPATLATYGRALLRGSLPKVPKADLHQLGGDVIIDRDGRIAFLHASRDPVDRPPVLTLMTILNDLRRETE